MAQIENGFITVSQAATVDGVLCLVVDCADFDHYQRLPAVVSYNGRVCGKTGGGNSDTGRCHYQSNAHIARVIQA